MQGISRVAFTLSAGVLALTAVAARAPAQTTPAPVPSDPATKTLVEKTCTSCHVLSQVTSQHKTAEQWGATVDQMIGYGAQVSDADYPKIIDYLAKNYGMPASGAKPAGH